MFSVIMAARDVEATIGEAIDSLLEGTESLTEILVVDDGSTDGTRLLADTYAARDARVRVLTGHGAGPGAARNCGLDEARGAWVTFVDSDDVVDHGYLDAIKDFLQAGVDTDLIAVNVVRLMHEGRRDNHPLRFRFEGGSRVGNLVDEPHLIHMSAAAGLFRRSVVEQAGLRFNESTRWSEDADFVVRFLLGGARPAIGLVANATYGYRSTDSSSLSRSAWSQPRKYVEPFEQFYLKWLDRPELPRWLEYATLYEISTYIDADRSVFHDSQAMSSETRARCAALIEAVVKRISREAIEKYAVTPLGLDRRMMLLACVEPAGILSDYVVSYQRRGGDPMAKRTYFYTGDRPQESWRQGGHPVEPVDTKIVGHRLFDRIFVRERICWLPSDGELSVTLDGVATPIRPYAGPPKRPSIPSSRKASQPTLTLRVLRAMRRRWSRGRPRPQPAAARQPEPGVEPATAPSPVWFYADRSHHAADNAEALYRAGRRLAIPGEHYFAIDPSSPDVARLREEGFVLVHPGTTKFDHAWRRATTMLWSDLADPLVTETTERLGVTHDQRIVFLQHGILSKQLWRWLNPRRIDLMLTTTQQEYEWIVGDDTSYTLTKHEVVRTGLPRHDRLFELANAVPEQERNIVLLAPTWEPALVQRLGGRGGDSTQHLLEASKFGKWLRFAHDSEFRSKCAQMGIEPALFVHPNMRHLQPWVSPRADLRLVEGRDVPEVLARARLVVTDNSSILDEAQLLGIPGLLVVGNQDMDSNDFHLYHQDVAAVRSMSGITLSLASIPGRRPLRQDLSSAAERVWQAIDRQASKPCQSHPRT